MSSVFLHSLQLSGYEESQVIQMGEIRISPGHVENNELSLFPEIYRIFAEPYWITHTPVYPSNFFGQLLVSLR